MPGGYGNSDVYVVSVNKGHYGAPKNMGATVNTKYKEYTPYVDGKYFVFFFKSTRWIRRF